MSDKVTDFIGGFIGRAIVFVPGLFVINGVREKDSLEYFTTPANYLDYLTDAHTYGLIFCVTAALTVFDMLFDTEDDDKKAHAA